jgi:sugar phosphate isomerase/epimerase
MRHKWTTRIIVAATYTALVLTSSKDAETARGQIAQSSEHTRDTPWAPLLYAYDFEASDTEHRSLKEEAQMLRELGYDGVGYVLWLDDMSESGPKLRMFGEEFDKNLQTLDDVGLPPLAFGISVNLASNAHLYDPRLVKVMRKLKGRPIVIAVMLEGFDPGDARGEKTATKVLRELGCLAAESNLRISIYHHVNSWTQRFDQALRVAELVNHPSVGVSFNLAHWLAVEGKRDCRPSVRAGGAKIFDVTINGAKVGATEIPRLIQPLDRGDFDNRQLLAILREMDYRGPIGLQCFGIPGDAREHLQRSMSVWKKWKAVWDKQDP